MRKAITLLFYSSLVFICFFLIIFVPKNSSASQLPNETLKFYAKNNILYYNPLGSLDCYTSSASLSAGNTYEEKIWNYFVNAGIPGVSDNAAVIAGIMGNFKQESGYDPFVQNNLGYTGLYQGDTVTYKTFTPIYNKINQTVGSNYWFTSSVGKVDSHPSGPTETAILIELDALTKNTPETGYGASFQNFVNNLGRVTNKTPSSYAELFQVEVERGVCNNNKPGAECHSYSQPITDPGVAQRAKEYYGKLWPSNGYDYQGMHERMAQAEDIYKTYASSSATSSSPSTSSAETESTESTTPSSSDDCFHSSSESFTRYDQTDKKYEKVFYDSSKSGGISSSVFESGCGPFSFAMLANALGIQNIDPLEVTKIAGDGGMHTGGSSHEITKYLADHYGMTYEKVSTGFNDPTYGNNLSDAEINKAIEAINSYLKKGWMIHTSGTSPMTESQMGQPFTPGGHYIGIRGITADGKWLLADSNGPNGSTTKSDTKGGIAYTYTRRGAENSTKEWDPATVIKNGMNVGNVHAIRASKTATCGNYTVSSPCGNLNSQGLVIGGMTLEQAQAYMNNYKTIAKSNSSSLISEYKINVTSCAGGSFYNCVAFSQYFIAVNTSTGPAGGLPDGKNVVGRLIDNGLATNGGNTPKPYAIFSRQSGGKGHGHTGVVLGVTDTDIIIGEADCYGGENGIKAKTIPLEKATSSDYTYAYLNNLTIGGY